MENWRKYLHEAECVTVGSLMKTVDQAQSDEKDAEDTERLKGWGWELAKNIAGLFPGAGAAMSAVSAAEVLLKVKGEMGEKGVSYDQVADYPVLGHLKIDPELIKVLEDDLLRQLDEMYEEQVLSKVSGDTCIDKIPNINDFIRKMVAKETEMHVVIDDKSPKK
jgi:hypothetical protein